MSTLFLFFLSDPTLGNREPPVSILLPGLVKHDHTAPLTSHRWPAKAPRPPNCKRYGRGMPWLGLKFILGKLGTAFISTGCCKSLFYKDREEDWKKHAGKLWVRWERSGRRQRSKVSKWGLSLTGLLEAPDFLLWFVTTWFQLSHWETFKHTYTHWSCRERLSAYLFGEWSKWFPLPSYSQTLNC